MIKFDYYYYSNYIYFSGVVQCNYEKSIVSIHEKEK